MPAAAKRAAIQKRESLRFPTLVAGQVRIGGIPHDTIIDNLSERGARIRLCKEIGLNMRVVLTAKGLDVSAVVIRKTDEGYGLRLDQPINPLAIVRANPWATPESRAPCAKS